MTPDYHHGRSTVLLFTASLLLAGPPRLASADDAAATLDTITSAWNARQTSVESFDFEWWVKRFESGEWNPRVRLEAAKNHAESAPPPDATFIATYRYAMDARGRIRMEYKGKEWSIDKSEFVSKHYVEIFDGNIRKSHFLESALGHPSASLGGFNNNNTVGKLVWLHPVNMVYRPFDKATGIFDSKKLELMHESPASESGPLMVLGFGEGDVWVDPNRDYLPVRYIVLRDGVKTWQMDLSFNRDERDGWAPNSWTIDELDRDGKSRVSESAKVLKFSINKPIADSEFELDLSAGAYVNDVSAKQVYIARPDGSHREIKRGEYNGHNYKELMESDPADR
jgi:hypothetical protein